MSSSTRNIVKAAAPVAIHDAFEEAILEKSEANMIARHGDRIVVGSARRATDPRFGRKIMITINTIGLNGLFDGDIRELATSDVHHVFHSVAVAAELEAIYDNDKEEAAIEAAIDAVEADDADLLASQFAK